MWVGLRPECRIWTQFSDRNYIRKYKTIKVTVFEKIRFSEKIFGNYLVPLFSQND